MLEPYEFQSIAHLSRRTFVALQTSYEHLRIVSTRGNRVPSEMDLSQRPGVAWQQSNWHGRKPKLPFVSRYSFNPTDFTVFRASIAIRVLPVRMNLAGLGPILLVVRSRFR
jgi:hypothetical protein